MYERVYQLVAMTAGVCTYMHTYIYICMYIYIYIYIYSVHIYCVRHVIDDHM